VANLSRVCFAADRERLSPFNVFAAGRCSTGIYTPAREYLASPLTAKGGPEDGHQS
jgi:hypothetical protein